MKSKTTVNIKTTLIRMFDQESGEIVKYQSTSQLSTPEAKEIAKARKLTFIDKTDTTTTFDTPNTELLKLKAQNEQV